MNLLLHICCAPCSIYPLKRFREEGIGVTGLFYNPNIHPGREYARRLETLVPWADRNDVELLYTDACPFEDFLRAVVHREEERCRVCYTLRLMETARLARERKYDGFSTTILYSRYQKHDLVREIGEELSAQWGVPFHYEDFRRGWAEGVAASREMGMYRQPYCGCLFSERERYGKKGGNA